MIGWREVKEVGRKGKKRISLYNINQKVTLFEIVTCILKVEQQQK